MKRISLFWAFILLATGTSWGQKDELITRYICQGDSLMDQFNTFEALQYYQQAYDLEDCLLTRTKLANCHFQRVAYQKATDLLKVMPEDSLSHESLRQLVFGYHKLSDIPAMVYWAEQTVMRYPMDAEVVAKLCSGFSQQNQPQNGVDRALKYIAVDSANIEVNRALQNAYFMDFQYDKAAETGDRLLALGDSVFTTFFLTGLSYSKLDSLNQSYSLLLKAATINEFRNEACVVRLGSTCLKLKYYDEALKYLTMAKDLIYPDTTVMRSFTLSLAEANYMTAHAHEAVEAWELHMAYNPTTIVTCYNIANAYAYLLNDRKKAKEYYELFLLRAKAEQAPTPALQEMIGRADAMVQYLSEAELDELPLPDEQELKRDSIPHDDLPTDSIKVTESL